MQLVIGHRSIDCPESRIPESSIQQLSFTEFHPDYMVSPGKRNNSANLKTTGLQLISNAFELCCQDCFQDSNLSRRYSVSSVWREYSACPVINSCFPFLAFTIETPASFESAIISRELTFSISTAFISVWRE